MFSVINFIGLLVSNDYRQTDPNGSIQSDWTDRSDHLTSSLSLLHLRTILNYVNIVQSTMLLNAAIFDSSLRFSSIKCLNVI